MESPTLTSQTRSLPKIFLLLILITTLMLIVYFHLADRRSLGYLIDMVGETVHNVSITDDDTRSSKVILFWTGFFGASFDRLTLSRFSSACGRNSCIYTSDKEQAGLSSAVVFHARDTNLYNLPSRMRSPDQYWVLFNLESPLNAGISDDYNSIFNLTMTYRNDSELTVTYGHYEPVMRTPHRMGTMQGDFKKRKPYAYWLVSNCDKERIKYVKRLSSFIQVDIFGKCVGLKPCLNNGADCELELSSSYAFYLAFENSLCPDYVTEKFWKVLASPGGAIPIVMGAPMSYYKAVAPPNSFIHAENFTTLRDLGAFLQVVSSSQESFNYYHRWRETYVAHEGLVAQLEKALCKLCLAIHDRTLLPTPAKVNLADWFNGGCRRAWPEM